MNRNFGESSSAFVDDYESRNKAHNGFGSCHLKWHYYQLKEGAIYTKTNKIWWWHYEKYLIKYF